MDINSLPTELFQDIMSYLCFKTLKVTSLVCRRWYLALMKFMNRNEQLILSTSAENHLNAVQNCMRDYQTICIVRIENWSNLQAVTTECIVRIPKTGKQSLAGCVQDCLNQFLNDYRNWVEQCEQLNDDRCTDYLVWGSEELELTFPNAKILQWTERRYGYGHKTVTINAPNLESVHIDDSLDASAVVRIPNCDNIKFIRCTLFTNHFDDTFVGNVSNVETLILKIDGGNCDISYLASMHQLRFLKLTFGTAPNALQNIEAMQQCNHLKELSIKILHSAPKKSPLNLNNVFKNFISLKTLELRALDIKVNGSLEAKKLQFFKLRDVTMPKNALSLRLPSLKVLSVSAKTLSILKLYKCNHFEELYVDLEKSNFKQSLQLTIIPFIKTHKNLKKLVMFRTGLETNLVEPRAKYYCMDLGLEHLVLYKINISIDIFKMLSKCTSLKSLTIVSCSITCKRFPYTVHLPSIQRMTLDSVQLWAAPRKDFPLKIGKVCEVQRVFSTYYTQIPKLESDDERFNPFDYDVIDPMHDPYYSNM